MTVWNGIITPIDGKTVSEQLVKLNRVTYIDHMFTAEYDGEVNRLYTPVTIRECGSSTNVMIDKAIWDTGANASCIAEEIAKRENMHPVETGIIATLAGQVEVAYYIVDIKLSEDIVIEHVKVAGVPMKKREDKFVIGMDVIARGNFSVKNSNGNTTVAFEV